MYISSATCILSLGNSRSIWEDLEHILRCVSFKRVSHHRKAFRPPFRVTRIFDDRYRSSMGVVLRRLEILQGGWERWWLTREQCRQAWKQWWQFWERWGHVRVHLQSLYFSFQNMSSPLVTLLVCLQIIATTHYSTIFKTHVFSLYSHLRIYVSIYLCIYIFMYLCIYVSMYLCIYASIYVFIYTRYIWTGCRWCCRELRSAPEYNNQLNPTIHCKAMIESLWRCIWMR